MKITTLRSCQIPIRMSKIKHKAPSVNEKVEQAELLHIARAALNTLEWVFINLTRIVPQIPLSDTEPRERNIYSHVKTSP